MNKPGRNNKNSPKIRVQPEFDQSIVDLARVTRVMAGGKRMRFRAAVVIGDKNGRVGWGVAKGADVAISVNKAVTQAKKNMIRVRFVDGTIPHAIEAKFKAAKVLLKPAVKGTGIIAGGAVRNVLELVGVSNIYGKILKRTGNKISNIKATFKALSLLQYPKTIAREEDEVKQVVEESEGRVDTNLDRDEELAKEQAKLLKEVGMVQDTVSTKLITHNKVVGKKR